MRLLGLIVVSFVLTACGGSSATTDEEPSQELKSVVAAATDYDYSMTVTINDPHIYLYVDDSVDSNWSVVEAVNTWNDAIGCSILVTSTDRDLADVLVYQIDEDDGSMGWYAQTYPVAELALNVWDNGPGWFSGPQLSTTIHELGHVLGLGHTDSPSDVMHGGDTTLLEMPVALSSNDLTELAGQEYTCD